MALSGADRAAVLLSALGESARKVIAHLGERERALLEERLRSLGRVSPELVQEAIAELRRALRRAAPQGTQRAPSPRGATGKEAPLLEVPAGLKALQELSADRLAEMLGGESPQVIAFVLVHLPPATAAEVLAMLPDELRAEVGVRMATLRDFSPLVVEEMGRLAEEVLRQARGTMRLSRGVEFMVEVMNNLEESKAQMVLQRLEQQDPALAEEIRKRMFVFEDLLKADDRGLQNLLRQVDTKALATALKVASEELKEKIFRNLSQRAAQALREEMEVLGPVRVSQVEAAQQEIIALARKLEQEGQLIVARGGMEFVE